jgi:hypothetical protein
VVGVNPERIRVRDLVEPLLRSRCACESAPQTERRDQNRLIFFEIVFVNVTLEISRNGELGPAPVGSVLTNRTPAAARRRKAALDLAVDIDTDETPAFFIAIRKGSGTMFGPAGLAARVNTRPKRSSRTSSSSFRLNVFFVNLADLLFDFKRAVATHEFERRQIFRRGFSGKPGTELSKIHS